MTLHNYFSAENRAGETGEAEPRAPEEEGRAGERGENEKAVRIFLCTFSCAFSRCIVEAKGFVV